MERRLPRGSGSSGKVRKLLTPGVSTMTIESGCVFNTRRRRGRRKNTFIKIARDHRDALVYGRGSNGRGGGQVSDRMAGDEFFLLFVPFPTIKWSDLHEIDFARYEILT